jgi:hypothetical protein
MPNPTTTTHLQQTPKTLNCRIRDKKRESVHVPLHHQMHSISNSTRWSSPKKNKTCSTSNSHAKPQKTLNCRIRDKKEYKCTYYTPSSDVTLNFQFRKVWSSPLTTRMAKECSPSRRQPSAGASCTRSADVALPPPPRPRSACVSPLPCPSASPCFFSFHPSRLPQCPNWGCRNWNPSSE